MADSLPHWRPSDWTPGAGSGLALADPTELIRGSDGVSTDSPQLTADAFALFPIFDATTLIGSRPAGWSATPDPADFARWHSAYQLAWMAEFADVHTVAADGFTYRTAVIGSAAEPMHNLNLLLSADGRRIVVLNHLQLTDVARLLPADQRAVTLHDEWVATVADRLNLRPAAGETLEAARADADALVDRARDDALVALGYGVDATDAATAQAARDAVAAEMATFLADPSVRADRWGLAVIAQLDILSDKLDRMSAFDMDAIGLAVRDLTERFLRLERFASVPAERASADPRMPYDVNAVGGISAIHAGLQALVRVELKLYDLAALAHEISLTGVYEGRPLDTPGLTFVLQTFENYRSEAKAEAKTEELNQRNLLMRDYARMQGYLNDTLASFDASSLSNPDDREYKSLKVPTEEVDAFWRTVAMFDSSRAGTDHPSEILTGVTRPMAAYTNGLSTSLPQEPKEFFDNMATQMGEANKQLGQDNQLMMSDISQINREKNRHFDMATNTLNKMTGILRSITDSGGGE